MAWVQSRNGRFRVLFRHGGTQHTFWLGEVTEREAQATADKVDYWLMRLKQGLVSLPPTCDVVEFVRYDGKPPEHLAAPASPAALTLAALRDTYLKAQRKKLEATTLAGIELHFAHLTRLLGPDRLAATLARSVLQGYVDARSAEWIDPNVYRQQRRAKAARLQPTRSTRKTRSSPDAADKPKRHPSPATVRKELVSLRTAWNWGRRQLGIRDEFPGTGLDFAKTEEALPYMTWDEAERRVKAGDEPEKVWGSVYLRPAELTDLLAWVETRPVSPWVYPLFCVAAHTGARRSEIVRALPSDVDLPAGVLTIREKKRDKKKLTTRRVPLTPFLTEVLRAWLAERGPGKTLFCKGDGKAITPNEAHNYFQRAVRLSKWNVLRGWHVFRHSLISAMASKGIDQRVIDDMVGHATDEQRRRYRHLYPDVSKQALASVFG